MEGLSVPAVNAASPFVTALQLVEQRRVISAQLAEVREESRRLIERTWRTMFAAYPGLHPIVGGSDLTLIAAELGPVPLCRECLAQKTGVPADRIDALVKMVAATVNVEIGSGQCRGCLRATSTYRFLTSDGAARPRPSTSQDGVWAFLEQHRGRKFCTACIQAALGTGRRIERLVLAAEGRGAIRRYEKCSGCGRDRLVASLAPR
jgi:hypothetical protein